MYKEYIQILPSADAETAPPLVTCTETFSGLMLPPPSTRADDDAASAPIAGPAPSAAAAAEPAAVTAPDLSPEPALAEALRTRAPSDGRIALIAATLALALSTGALTWTLSRPLPAEPHGDVAALTAEVADLKTRLAASDAQLRAGSARLQELAERLERTDRTQSEAATAATASVAGLAAQLASMEAGLDNRVKVATEAAIAATLPSPADITASIAARPSPEPTRPPVQPAPPPTAIPAAATPAPPKPSVARGWVLRDVAHGVALVENRHGFFEVAVGTPLPGLGRVEAIERRDGRMVVVTSRGLILSAQRQ
jgi:hypothetical protein